MSPRRRLWLMLTVPFRAGERLYGPLLLLFAAINGLVLVNARLHDPTVGYDAEGHLTYIAVLSDWRVVTDADTNEFFSPPLPYVFPALLVSRAGMELVEAARWAQLANVILSLGLTFFLLRLCLLIGQRVELRMGALAALGVLPVYYRTFAFVRGEPYVAFFAVVALFYAIRVFVKDRPPLPDALLMGGALGLGAISRQWGVMMLPAVFGFGALQWLRCAGSRRRLARALIAGLLAALLAGGWYYAVFYRVHGTLTPFNRNAAPTFAFSNQPLAFYTDLSLDHLFTQPVRPNFLNRLWPVLYADLWGDYWAYFSVVGLDTATDAYLSGKELWRATQQTPRPDSLLTNYDSFGAYLGRVNRVSLYAFGLGVAAVLFALAQTWRSRSEERGAILLLLLLSVGLTLAGYLWFLIRYPMPELGDTIKAAYVLQVCVPLAVLVGCLLEEVSLRHRRLYPILLGGLGLTALHNLPAMVTHYPATLPLVDGVVALPLAAGVVAYVVWLLRGGPPNAYALGFLVICATLLAVSESATGIVGGIVRLRAATVGLAAGATVAAVAALDLATRLSGRGKPGAHGAQAFAAAVLALGLLWAGRDAMLRFPPGVETYDARRIGNLDVWTRLDWLAGRNAIYLSMDAVDDEVLKLLRQRHDVRTLDLDATVVLPSPGQGAVYALAPEQASRAEALAGLWPDAQWEMTTDRFGRPSLALVRVPASALSEWPESLAPEDAQEVRFEGGPTLLGMKQDGKTLRLFWRGEESMPRDLTAFVHLLDAQGGRVGQADRLPGDGSYPTTVWHPGERVIEDLSPDLADCTGGQSFEVLTGWYELIAAGMRRPRADGQGDSVVAGTYRCP